MGNPQLGPMLTNWPCAEIQRPDPPYVSEWTHVNSKATSKSKVLGLDFLGLDKILATVAQELTLALNMVLLTKS